MCVTHWYEALGVVDFYVVFFGLGLEIIDGVMLNFYRSRRVS